MANASYGHEDAGVIALDFWLIVTRGEPKRGWPGHRYAPSARVVANEPSLGRNERAIKLAINLPVAIFETPSLRASINIEKPNEAVSIDVAGVAEAVRSAIGMDVDIRVVEPEDSENG